MGAETTRDAGAAPVPSAHGGTGDRTKVPRWRRAAGSAFSIAVVVAVFGFVLPAVADYGEVLDTIGAMTWLEVALLVLVAVLNLATYQPSLMAALPGLRFSQAVQVSQASTAVSNTVPAGAAFGLGLSARMYRSWGFGRRPVTLALMLAGIWNIFAKLALPVIAVALLVLSGVANRGLAAASAFGVATLIGALVAFAAILRGEGAAFRVGEWGSDGVNWLRARLGRAPIGGFGHTLVKFRRETIDVLRTRWVPLTLATMVSQVSLMAVLLMSLRNVGVGQDDVSWQQVFATFALVRLLSALPVTPGGVGVVELGMTAGLVAAGGARTDVVAAVLVYRALTYLPPIPIGAACYVHWRRRATGPDRADGTGTPVPGAALGS